MARFRSKVTGVTLSAEGDVAAALGHEFERIDAPVKDAAEEPVKAPARRARTRKPSTED